MPLGCQLKENIPAPSQKSALLLPFSPLAVARPAPSSVSGLCWALQMPVGLDGITYSGSHEVGMGSLNGPNIFTVKYCMLKKEK